MREYFYSLIAKILAFIGGTIFFVPILFYFFGWTMVGYIPDDLFEEHIIILAGCAVLGFAMILGGGNIQRRFGVRESFLANNGGPIHSGRVWKKGTESGLYQTSCGLVVSASHDSAATAHVGYRIVLAERTTCKDCAQREGRVILDANVYRPGH